MANSGHATFNNPALTSTIQRELRSLNYNKRPVKRTKPRLIDAGYTPSIPNKHIPIFSEIFVDEFKQIPLVTDTKIIQNQPQILEEDENILNSIIYNDDTPSSATIKKESARKSKTLKVRKSKSKTQLSLLFLAGLLFIGGSIIAFMGLKLDHTAQVQAANLTNQANQQANNNSSSTKPSTALSTIKPTDSSLSSYVVAPNLPRYLKIPSLSVNSRVLSVGVNSKGAIGTPNNVFDTAWYNESAQPGKTGAMLIDGHISSWTSHGVFYGLNILKPGDNMQIVRGDGVVFNYIVIKTQTYSADNVDMKAALAPLLPGTNGLNLISCSGDVSKGTSEFNQRIVVFTKQV